MHVIRQHTFDIGCPSKTLGSEIHNQLGMLLEQQFYPKLDIMLDNHGISGQHWTIDFLELELPVISPKNWKKELVGHLLQQMEAYLSTNAPLHSITGTKKQQTERTNGLQIVTDAQQAEFLFFSFLETGVLGVNTLSPQLEKITTFIEVTQQFTEHLFEQFLRNKQSLMRWVFSVPSFFKDKVAKTCIGFPSHFQELFTGFHKISGQAENPLSLKRKYAKQLPAHYVEVLQWLMVLYGSYPEKEQFYLRLAIEFSSTYFAVSAKQLYETISIINTTLKTDNKIINSKEKLFLKTFEKEISSVIKSNGITSYTYSIDANKDLLLQQNGSETNTITNTASIADVQFIANAGLVILHPFLKPLFMQLGLCREEDNSWRNKVSPQKAVVLLHYLVTGKTKCTENELLLNKILCGLPAEEVINVKLSITKKEKEKCNSLLSAILEHWTPLNKSSVKTLQQTFLQRDGRLETGENHELWVEEKGYDILLDKLPWAIGTIQTPWMENYLTCYWN